MCVSVCVCVYMSVYVCIYVSVCVYVYIYLGYSKRIFNVLLLNVYISSGTTYVNTACQMYYAITIHFANVCRKVAQSSATTYATASTRSSII